MRSVKNLQLVAGTQELRLDVTLPTENGRAWRAATSSVDLGDVVDSPEAWREDMATGATLLSKETWVASNDWHWDAKCWPVFHPYGTGSAFSEQGSGAIQRYVSNRLALLQSDFRKSPTWVFQQLDRQIANQLYHSERCRRQAGRPSAKQDETDPYRKCYGVAAAVNLPETPTWWDKQQKNLYAMSDDSEFGMFATMTTITHCDASPELLAVIRRGPLALPTEAEMAEYPAFFIICYSENSLS